MLPSTSRPARQSEEAKLLNRMGQRVKDLRKQLQESTTRNNILLASVAQLETDNARLTDNHTRLTNTHENFQHGENQFMNAHAALAVQHEKLVAANAQLTNTNQALAEGNALMLNELQAFKGTVGQNTTCTICRELFIRPVVTRECGHTFCKGCIAGWLLQRWTDENPGRKLESQVAPLEDMQIYHLSEFQPDEEFYDDIEDWPANNYKCPICRKRLWREPTRNFSVEAITECMLDGDDNRNDPGIKAEEGRIMSRLFCTEDIA